MAYKTFTGKGNANEWQRSSKKSQYSDKLVGAGISSEKSKFLKNLASDLSQIYGVVSGGVDGVLAAVGDKFASVQQDSDGNIFKNPGDTTKVPPMITKGSYKADGGGVLKDADGFKVKSGGGPITWGNGPQYGTARGIDMSDIAGELNTKGNALKDPRIKSRMNSGEAQEFFNSTNNLAPRSTRAGNPLLDFETMTYIITFSAISSNNYNNGTYRTRPGTVIAKTGGKGRQGTGPLSYDYYIERLSTANSVGPTEKAYSTNTYSINFDITEPLGVDLIPALIEASMRQGHKTHLGAPYLIKIEFVGNDDNGIPQKIAGTERYIPIRLMKIELDVDEGGGRYKIVAVPMANTALFDVNDTLQESIVHSGGSVEEVFVSFFDILNQTRTQLSEDVHDKTNFKPNLYKFDIESSVADIIKSKLGFDQPGASANQSINVSVLEGGNPINSSLRASRKITANKGLSIVEYMTHVVQNSDFMLNQFNESNDANDTTIKVVKIMPSTEIVEADNGQGEPQYRFVYAVRLQNIALESTNLAPVRTYNYIYTGENKDVLGLELKYNFAYYQPGRYYDALQNKIKNDDDTVDKEKTNQGSQFPRDGGNPGGYNTPRVPVSQDANGFTSNSDATGKNREMSDVFRKILENPGADLLVINLAILGDPYYIEQKSTRPGPKKMTSDGQTEPDGSVSPDANNVIVQINARYPSDLNDDTGLMRLDQSAFFKGKFKVIICGSDFENGVFSQNLQLVRFNGQENDKSVPKPYSFAGTDPYSVGDEQRQFSGYTSNVSLIDKSKTTVSDKQKGFNQRFGQKFNNKKISRVDAAKKIRADRLPLGFY